MSIQIVVRGCICFVNITLIFMNKCILLGKSTNVLERRREDVYIVSCFCFSVLSLNCMEHLERRLISIKECNKWINQIYLPIDWKCLYGEQKCPLNTPQWTKCKTIYWTNKHGKTKALYSIKGELQQQFCNDLVKILK